MSTSDDWYSIHSLIHYTSSIDTVVSILQQGFLLVPNKRNLIKSFLPSYPIKDREPQEFGMVSFTELPLEAAQSHREQFGEFGIAVSWGWALANGGHRVLYISDQGLVFEVFKWFFELAEQEMKSLTLKGNQKVMYENKAVAGAYRAQIYANLLTLYEYMEPARSSSQVEWRIVNKIPLYLSGCSKSEQIAELLTAAKAWKIGVVKVVPNDIEMIVCPVNHVHELRGAIPRGFQTVPIFPYTSKSSLAYHLRAAVKWLLQLRRWRERIVYRYQPPPPGSILLPKAQDGRAVLLPPVARIWGIGYYPDQVLRRSFCRLQYEDRNSQLFEVEMPVLDALYLLNLLRTVEHDSGLESVNRPPG